ncbi:MAG: hypothetical protein LBP33_08120 [Candidatus Adiutrix sp.]|jgi:hypothetical protein|nr:hypothetical protein [Candidatus Adiutrix sp.]
MPTIARLPHTISFYLLQFFPLASINSKREIKREWVEFQLAHASASVLGKVSAAYQQGDYKEDRFPVMQWWADAVDAMERGVDLPKVKPYFE